MPVVSWGGQGQSYTAPPSGNKSRSSIVVNSRNQANRWEVQGLGPSQGGSAVAALTSQFGAMSPFGSRRKSRKNMRKRNQRKRKTSRK